MVEGYIYQCIEYISEQSKLHDNEHQLIQNIVLELIIQVIQEQEVQGELNKKVIIFPRLADYFLFVVYRWVFFCKSFSAKLFC